MGCRAAGGRGGVVSAETDPKAMEGCSPSMRVLCALRGALHRSRGQGPCSKCPSLAHGTVRAKSLEKGSSLRAACCGSAPVRAYSTGRGPAHTGSCRPCILALRQRSSGKMTVHPHSETSVTPSLSQHLLAANRPESLPMESLSRDPPLSSSPC